MSLTPQSRRRRPWRCRAANVPTRHGSVVGGEKAAVVEPLLSSPARPHVSQPARHTHTGSQSSPACTHMQIRKGGRTAHFSASGQRKSRVLWCCSPQTGCTARRSSATAAGQPWLLCELDAPGRTPYRSRCSGSALSGYELLIIFPQIGLTTEITALSALCRALTWLHKP